MKNAEQLNYRELNPAEVAEANGGVRDALRIMLQTLWDAITDPNCTCGDDTVYIP